MKSEINKVLNELKDIKINIEFIKEHMVDADTILTAEEEEKLDKSIEEFRSGKTTSIRRFKRE